MRSWNSKAIRLHISTRIMRVDIQNVRTIQSHKKISFIKLLILITITFYQYLPSSNCYPVQKYNLELPRIRASLFDPRRRGASLVITRQNKRNNLKELKKYGIV